MTDRSNRDAAEGAGLPPTNDALHTPDVIASLQQRALAPPKPVPQFDYCCHGIERKDCEQCSRAIPKPAPDAMREALKPFADIAQFIVAAQRDTRPFIFGVDTVIAQRLTVGHLRNARTAYLSAPVPPADGATKESEAQINTLRALHDTEERDVDFVFDQLRGTVDPREVIKSFRKQIIIAAASAGYPLPSPAVAAEPLGWLWHSQDNLEWKYSCGPKEPECWKVRQPVYATPPVRGDRKAIAREIKRVVGRDLNPAQCSNLADAILSLFKDQIK